MSFLKARDDIQDPVIFIGAGGMGGAMQDGLSLGGTPVVAMVRNVDGYKSKNIKGVDFVGNASDLPKSLISVFAAKPFQVHDLIPLLATRVKEGGFIISVAAGISGESLNSLLSESPRVKAIRAMPNTPIAIGRGVIGVICESEEEKGAVNKVFCASGQNQIVCCSNDDEIDLVTSFSGSGPAYVFACIEAIVKAATEANSELAQDAKVADIFASAMENFDPSNAKCDIYEGSLEDMAGVIVNSENPNNGVGEFAKSFAKAMYDEAIKKGFSPDDAKKLSIGTLEGSAIYCREMSSRKIDPKDAGTLRGNVTSPNGTTAAGLNKLTNLDCGLLGLITETTNAARSRAKEISQEFSKKS